MRTDSHDDDAPSREEIADTWRWKQSAASWIASLSRPSGDAATVNRWMAATVARLLNDFAPLARVRTAMLLADVGPTRLTRRPDETYAQFHARMLEAIAAQPLPLSEVLLELDLRVWVRTVESPDRPELAWISYPGTEIDLEDQRDGTVSVAFRLANTLFSAFTYMDGDDNPLHPFNQPLLEAALHRLRSFSDEPLDLMGDLPGTHELGFSSDRDDY